jgi:hypothetical protein
MATKDPRIDAYIAKSGDFAKPILTRLRRVIHTACPDVEEGLKWSHPHFDYKGIFCGVAAFKSHCTFGFWKHALLVRQGVLPKGDKAWGQFGCLRSVKDLPSDAALARIIKAAAKLNDEGVAVPRRAPKAKPPLKTPADLAAALRRNARAGATYAAFSPSAKRDYVEWIIEAKTAETRTRRLATAVNWMAAGKRRNWKYEK